MTKVDSQQLVCVGSLPPGSPSIPVRTALIHPRGPGCPLAHTAPTRADKPCVPAYVLTAWWWFSADNLSVFVAPFLGEEAEYRRVEDQAGWGGSSNGLQMHRPHPREKALLFTRSSPLAIN